MTGQEVINDTDNEADAVYDTLIQHAGVVDSESGRRQFRSFYENRFEAREFRFEGDLGYGGKIFFAKYESPYVTCYREDKTDTRRAMIKATNDALKGVESTNERGS